MIVHIGHAEFVAAVQRAMALQLKKDEKAQPNAELALTFYSHSPGDMRVLGTIQHNGKIIDTMTGRREHLAAIATQIALDRLKPAQKVGLNPSAEVHFSLLESEAEQVQMFAIEVHFRPQTTKPAAVH